MIDAAHQPYVFVSHSSRDRPRVLPVVDLLKAAGVNTWIDKEGIRGGANYALEIAEAIEHSAVLLLLCSDASLSSRSVRQEIALAWRFERPYLPLMLDKVKIPKDVAFWLEAAQRIDLLDHSEQIWLPKVLTALAQFGFVTPASSTPAATPRHPEQLIKLPFVPSRLLGRELELAEIVSLLHQPEVRLLTLTGPGGVGKTRLATAVGDAVDEDVAHAVVFIDLSSIRDPVLVGPAIADALGVQLGGEQSLEQQLTAALSGQRSLLIIDNFEQVLDAAPLLSALLTSTASLKILVTSRAQLHLQTEREYPVAPLDVPDEDQPLFLDELVNNPAVSLFVDRARAVKPDVSLDDRNAQTIVAICRRLDGLPLAIELAAARMRVLSPAALLARLESTLALLTGGEQDRPVRHHTLRDTIAWSYDLLTPEEQMVFAQLAVFAGGAPLAAVEAICGEGTHSCVDLLDHLDALVGASLVRQTESSDGEPRFTMLETIREYATEQLALRTDSEAVKRAHAAFYMAMAQTADAVMFGAGQAPWLERLEVEHGNFRAALRWLRECDDVTKALQLATALCRFWYVRGHLDQGISILSDLLKQATEVEPTLLADALLGLGELSFKAGKLPQARTYLERSVSTYHQIGDDQGIGWAKVFLGHVAGAQHDDTFALECVEESLEIFRQVDDQLGMARALNALGETMRSAGKDARAAKFYEEALAIDRASGNQAGAAIRLHNLGYVDLHLRSMKCAAARFQESLLIHQELGDAIGVMQSVEGLAATAAAAGRAKLAALLFGTADALRQETGMWIDVADMPEHDRFVKITKEKLGARGFETSYRTGSQLSLADALSRARHDLHLEAARA